MRDTNFPTALQLSGLNHSAHVERVAEASLENDDDQATFFAVGPSYGLFCRRQWKQVTKRHDCKHPRQASESPRTEGAEPAGRR
jgi:hypothetical protein